MKSDGSQHRFFNALVLMGGSVAVGCGGVTTEQSARESGDPGAGGRSNPADGTGGASVPGSGGSFIAGSGGFGAGPGILVPPSGGPTGNGGYTSYPASGGGAPATGVDGGSADCPATQWDCSSTGVDCWSGVKGWALPEHCVCDVRRPRSNADCGKGQSFVCRKGIVSVDDSGTVQETPFECYCVENASDCGVCDSMYQRSINASCEVQAYSNGRMDVLCGCAVVYLR